MNLLCFKRWLLKYIIVFEVLEKQAECCLCLTLSCYIVLLYLTLALLLLYNILNISEDFTPAVMLYSVLWMGKHLNRI